MATPVYATNLTGDKQLLKRLRELQPKLQKRGLTKAARLAMKPMHAKAKSSAPKESGTLRKSIKLRAMKRSRVRVGMHISTSESMFEGKTFYGAFQEFGWHVGKRDNKLRSRGKWSGIGTELDKRKFIPGKHFIEETYQNGKEKAARQFVDETEKQLHLLANGG